MFIDNYILSNIFTDDCEFICHFYSQKADWLFLFAYHF
jgi:hypothetical protein